MRKGGKEFSQREVKGWVDGCHLGGGGYHCQELGLAKRVARLCAHVGGEREERDELEGVRRLATVTAREVS